MMDRETALNTLRLAADASHTDVIAAYSRLARRYPLQQFPERHARLLEAKTALLSPELAFRDMLFDEQIDMSWLNRYSSQDESNQNPVSADESRLQPCLETLFRPHLRKGTALFPMSTHMLDGLGQLLDELGPDGLEELIEKLDLR